MADFALDPRRARQRGRAITASDRDGSARLLSDGRIFSMGRWDGSQWVYARSNIPLDIIPTEVLL